MALTRTRHTLARSGDKFSFPVAASVKVWAGSLVAMNATGYVQPGTTATDVRGVGRAAETVDNTGGGDGAVTMHVERGVFRFANDGTDTVGLQHVGTACYIVDDETVASTDGTGTRSIAGAVRDVDSSGVWVEF